MSRLNLRTNKVQSSFRVLQKRLSVVVKRINAEAAAQMKLGRYDSAKELMEVGRSFSQFYPKVNEISKDWDDLTAQTISQLGDLGLTTAIRQVKVTSPNALCIPALVVALKRGGTAEMADVISGLDSAGAALWKDGDLVQTGGTLQWQLTLGKSYRLCQRRGFVEKRTDGIWKITEKGRAAVHENEK